MNSTRQSLAFRDDGEQQTLSPKPGVSTASVSLLPGDPPPNRSTREYNCPRLQMQDRHRSFAVVAKLPAAQLDR